MNRRTFLGVTGLFGAALLAGCSGGQGSSSAASASALASASASSQASGGSAAATASFTVGTLATEDLLPLWVAQDRGLFDGGGVQVEIVPFQSATELIAGVASGEVDLAMTDIMVTASMFASGIDVQMQWVTLGATADQGRFGIMVGPDSSITKLTDLAGVPIGVGSNTILEYVMDKLMEDAGVADDQIVVEELQKLPVRYQAMASGEVAAAALPGTLLALGEANNCKLIADDTQGDNLSQSVMIVRSDVLSAADAQAGIAALEAVWDEAAKLVNADPESYREILIDSASLPIEIADTYPISTYPTAALPTSAMVDPVLDWMQQKGYLTQSLSYDEKTGAFATK
ncbi:MAG: ABC transporter substrate-binding protein [Eggerthellaceae bacterium]|nr:ABC transporter substrate-binding protein [Eggerthellaceae bacterium]